MEKKYPAVTPYLIVDNAQKFIDFTEMVFDMKVRLKEMRDEKIIKHAEIEIDDSIIMCADAVGEWKAQPASFFITVKDADESFQKALDHGATIISDIADLDYGRSGGVKDPCGNTWWIASGVK